MNVVLVSLDCVRHEALSCYAERFDYLETVPHRAETPTIDAIAQDGTVFTKAFTQAPFTPASHASVFTGTNPYQHGIRSMFGCELNEGLSTLAERFRDVGYETGGFIGAHALSSEYGVDRGFETYDESFDTARTNWIVGNRRPGSEVTDEALEWLDGVDDKFFLFVHYFDAHDGGGQPAEETGSTQPDTDGGDSHRPLHARLYNRYLRPVDSFTGDLGRRLYRSWSDLRDDTPAGRRYHLRQVQRIDEQINRLTQFLVARDQYEETLIVLFADHGDAFGEHGEYGHREYVYDTTMRVPLIVKPPSSESGDVDIDDTLTRLIDVFPTVTSMAGLEQTQSPGENVLDLGRRDDDDRTAYGETRCESSPEELRHPHTDFVCLRSSEWKLIVDQLEGKEELYHVASDPAERNNLATSRPDVRQTMREQLESLTADHAKEDDIDMSQTTPSIVDQLEGLGYL